MRTQAEVAFRNSDASLSAFGSLFDFADAPFHIVCKLEQFFPRTLGLLLVAQALQHGIATLRTLAHHVDGNVIQILAGALEQIARPQVFVAAAIAPADQP